MKRIISLPMVVLLGIMCQNTQAFFKDRCGEGPFETSRWFVTPKIGVAPTIFASRSAEQLYVVPQAAINQTLCSGQNPVCNVDNYANVLQQGPCLPKFGDMFHQGVLHVGVELGRNVCDRSAAFVEFVYNRAQGKQVCNNNYITNRAVPGCSSDCESSSCSSVSVFDGCCTTAPSLSAVTSVTDDFDNYTAYGAYVGGRHFTDRFWCESTSFWYGYKVGILHRKQINATSNVEASLASGCGCTEDESIRQCASRAVFCKSNSVSGGFQIGFDYCYRDCLSFQLGFEVVASCGLAGNRNRPIELSAITCDADRPLTNCIPLPSNVLITNTGTVVNFPVWFGLRWEFGCCDTDVCCN